MRVVASNANKELQNMASSLSRGQMHVGNALTVDNANGRYTTYEIKIKTSDIAYTLSESCVRRRYSEFVWLRRHLAKSYPERTPPSLPPKRFFGRQFKDDTIMERVQGLREFLQCVVSENVYMSDAVVHLFLQTALPVTQIRSRMNELHPKSATCIIEEQGRQEATVPLDTPAAVNHDVTETRPHPCRLATPFVTPVPTPYATPNSADSTASGTPDNDSNCSPSINSGRSDGSAVSSDDRHVSFSPRVTVNDNGL